MKLLGLFWGDRGKREEVGGVEGCEEEKVDYLGMKYRSTIWGKCWELIRSLSGFRFGSYKENCCIQRMNRQQLKEVVGEILNPSLGRSGKFYIFRTDRYCSSWWSFHIIKCVQNWIIIDFDEILFVMFIFGFQIEFSGSIRIFLLHINIFSGR